MLLSYIHMIFHNPFDVNAFGSCVKASIVIHQCSHARWEVQHTVHQVAKGGAT